MSTIPSAESLRRRYPAVVADLEAGAYPVDVARRYGFVRQTVSDWRRALGLPPLPPRDKAIQRHRRDWTLLDDVEPCWLSREDYRRHLMTAPSRRPMARTPSWYERPTIVGRHPKPLTAEERAEVVSLVDDGYWPLDVAVAYGITVRRRPATRTQPSCFKSNIYNYVDEWRGVSA